MYIDAMASNDSIIYVGNNANYLGAFKSNNYGQSWQAINNGLEFYPGYVEQIKNLAAKDSFVYAGTGSGIVYRSSNYGELWSPVPDGLPVGFFKSLTAIDDYVITSIDGYGLFKLYNNSNTWQQIIPDAENYYVSPIFKDSNSELWAGTNSGVFKISEDQSTWQAMNTGFFASSTTFRIANIDSSLYTGSIFGELNKTDDMGETWVNLNNDVITPTTYILHFLSFGTDGLLIDGYNDQFISLDQGNNWTFINPGNKKVKSE